MAEHFVTIQTWKAKGQIGVPIVSKIKQSAAYCRCGWDTGIGIEQDISTSRPTGTLAGSPPPGPGVFTRAMEHLIEHDSMGFYDYNGLGVPKSWRQSLPWLGEEKAHRYGITKDRDDQ